MKKIIITTMAAMAVTTGAFAQGVVAWAAGSGGAGAVSFSTDKQNIIAGFPVGAISTLGANAGSYVGQQLHVDFFVAPNGTALTLDSQNLPIFSAAWTDMNQVAQQIKVSAGRMSSTVSIAQAGNLAGTAGSAVQFEVVGWTGTATTWAQAVANSGSILIGYAGELFNGSQLGSLSWSQATGDSGKATPDQPASMVLGSGGYNGLVLQPVPEPSTIALGGLGVAALLAFRRRK